MLLILHLKKKEVDSDDGGSRAAVSTLGDEMPLRDITLRDSMAGGAGFSQSPGTCNDAGERQG